METLPLPNKSAQSENAFAAMFPAVKEGKFLSPERENKTGSLEAGQKESVFSQKFDEISAEKGLPEEEILPEEVKKFLSKLESLLEELGIRPEAELSEDPMAWLAQAEVLLNQLVVQVEELPAGFLQAWNDLLREAVDTGLLNPEVADVSALVDSLASLNILQQPLENTEKSIGNETDSKESKKETVHLERLVNLLGEVQQSISKLPEEFQAKLQSPFPAEAVSGTPAEKIALPETKILQEPILVAGPRSGMVEELVLSKAQTDVADKLNKVTQDVQQNATNKESLLDGATKILKGDSDEGKQERGNDKGDPREAPKQQEIRAQDLLGGVSPKISALKVEAVDSVSKSGFLSRESTENRDVQIVRQVSQKLRVTLGKGHSRATLQLYPEQLGKVEIKIDIKDGNVRLHMRVESETVRTALEGQLNQLKETFQNQSLNLDRVDVQVNQERSQERQAMEQKRQNSGHTTGREVSVSVEQQSDGSDTGRRLGYNQFEFVA